MGRPLRILHTADSHIGAELPARPRDDRPRRGDDFVDSFSRVLDHALNEEVDLVIHAGDLLDLPNPSSRALAAAGEPILKLAASGIPMIIVPGNHERSTIPANLFLAHRNIHIVTEPRTLTFRLNGHNVADSSFPCLRREATERFPIALASTEWSFAKADLRILAVHATFESAICGQANYRFRGGDNVVPREAIPDAFDYVACGHVHRHQVLPMPDMEESCLVYAGSPDRISFAERDEPKGFVMIEEAGGRLTHRFVEHDVRPMSIHPLVVSGLTRVQIIGQVETVIRNLPPRAIAQVRLSGCTTQETLRRTGFSALARSVRPDVICSVMDQDVEFASAHIIVRRSSPGSSVFDALDAPRQESVRASVAELKRLPTGRGVYALHDTAGRVLYIGKAKNIRARVRTHLHGGNGTNAFDGWSRQAAHVEARLADSDLEALLIEAELIRELRPPFNRQMRRWMRYCYLCEDCSAYGQLVIADEPIVDGRCYGPFRSRRLAESVRDSATVYFGMAPSSDEYISSRKLTFIDHAATGRSYERHYQSLLMGPCADRLGSPEFESRILQRDALLSGVDDTSVRELEARLEDLTTADRMVDRICLLARQVSTLRFAFDHAATLRSAEKLMRGLLILPGSDGGRKVGILTQEGVRFDMLDQDPIEAERILKQYKRMNKRISENKPGRLPRAVMDVFCIVERELRKKPCSYRFIPPQELREYGAPTLLAVAFGDGARLVEIRHQVEVVPSARVR